MSRALDALRSAWALYGNAPAFWMLCLGFSSGLPNLLIFGTLSFWLREAGVELATIGFLSWVGLVYAFKWLWAPWVDRCSIPLLTRRLGRRRAWMLCSQLAVFAGLLALAVVDPSQELTLTAVLALAVGLASATQDIALDAYRIESSEVKNQAALSATYQAGYRLAMIWSGAGALAIAAWTAVESGYDASAWRVSYAAMAASSLVGVVATLFSRESLATAPSIRPERSWAVKFQESFLAPLQDFYRRYGRLTGWLLAVVALYRTADVVMGVMANPFYADIGFTKEEVAAISKVFGVLMTLTGAFAGGVVTYRLGVLKSLMLGGFLAACTNLLFCGLAAWGPSRLGLIAVVCVDNLASGLATVAFLAFLSGLTSRDYSATQYALLSSAMVLVPKFLAGFSGVAVDEVGYSGFFLLTALLGLPVVALIALLIRKMPDFDRQWRPD